MLRRVDACTVPGVTDSASAANGLSASAIVEGIRRIPCAVRDRRIGISVSRVNLPMAANGKKAYRSGEPS